MRHRIERCVSRMRGDPVIWGTVPRPDHDAHSTAPIRRCSSRPARRRYAPGRIATANDVLLITDRTDCQTSGMDEETGVDPAELGALSQFAVCDTARVEH